MLELITLALFQFATLTGSPATGQAAYKPNTTISPDSPAGPQQSAGEDVASDIGNEGWDND